MRIETKYQVSPREFIILKEALTSLFKADVHSGDEGYLVSSLYYDSPDLKAYFDKVEGESQKTKWRYRMYDLAPETIRLEEKKKSGRISTKMIHPVNFQKPSDIQPKLLVEYRRLAFVEGKNRYTLDCDLKFARAFEHEDFFKTPLISSDVLIFETKTYSDQENPLLDQLLSQLNLTSSPISKYTLGMREIYDL